ncbi:phosphoribosylformylglycinamidine synthase [Peptoniphilus catoniae]|uniref:phosphoribosylformylglycinamidine synthase n=1 Tax=Peptoniphilus catoniae TaxID=1660341 RepID=UPI0010FDDA57|nr:phosphoribosylformylglycinamidine synthase [Peptoniphilus catoniae]
MKILIVGSGGREYALGTKLLEKDSTRQLYFAPGNGGTGKLGKDTGISAENIDSLLKFAKEEKIDYTVVGPEAALCSGIVDKFQNEGLKIYGPNKEAAEFENSKAFTKRFLKKYKIPTADYIETKDFKEAVDFAEKLLNEKGRTVIKADGLAAGKGVFITSDFEEARDFLDEVLNKNKFNCDKVVIEEFLSGFEMSLISLTDSKTILALPTSRDHKKIFTGELGPNTGGMGTFSPNIEAEPFLERIRKEILDPVLQGLKSEGIDYRGTLFIGLMIGDKDIDVLEFNVRFGDPETQVILENIENDLLELLQATSEARLSEVELKLNKKKTLCLVLASGGYPGSYEKGKKISFDDGIKSKIYHAGTALKDGKLVTDGGRVLNLVYSADTFDEAIKQVYEDAKKVHFDGMYYRKDIGPGVKRVYVCKKDEFDFESKGLTEEIKSSLGIDLDSVKLYKRYDIETSEEVIDKIKYTILSERPVDDIYIGEDALKLQKELENPIASAYLPGQFSQREQGLLDTISLVVDEDIKVSYSTVYDFKGVKEEDLEKIENYIINPVDSHRVPILNVPTTLSSTKSVNRENLVYEGFIDYNDKELRDFIDKQSLAMSFEDALMVRDYFKSENRDPNETEIAILDTYWSDHCRHTTFNTELNIDFNPLTELDKMIKESFDNYLEMRKELNIKKPISLMSFGTILAKYLREKGKLEDLEISSEINACSVRIKVRVDKDGKEELEDYLLMFKNETHNHPTEIEPLGGASTCLGGAIRDPLSGRSYVYQAMRITGSADPKTPIKDTLKGKLPQRKITTEAAKGYSSYGNQIGLTTGYVDEIYHPGYVAKRMEAGAVIAAAPEENVRRIEPTPGDIVVLLGGRTGRDGIGGATGSSKTHTVSSIVTESAQVQKGNAPEERKIQRLFRNPKVAKMIKKCNDFGAGGVSVAIGELHDGVEIYLDKVLLKYAGLKPREIAISESQERMAIVIDKNDYKEFEKYALEENLELRIVANVTDNNKMLMYYEDQLICDLSYDFINTNGADRKEKVKVTSEDVAKVLNNSDKDPKNLAKYLKDLNNTSKRNLYEIFDTTVGRATVLNPLGGNQQYNPTQAMVAKIPSLKGDTKTVSLMSYGFNPYLSEESQYLGGYYAVIESIAKLVATGASLDKIRLSFQEFYQKMDSQEVWSKPLKSLLGAFEASKFFEAPPIGGKDSMSGSFEDIHVPPTLVSFAVTTADIENIVSQDLKGKGKLGLIESKINSKGMLDLKDLKEKMERLNKEIKDKNVISAFAVTKSTLVQIYEQALGNTGFDIELEDLYSPKYGSFVVEYKEDRDFIKEIGSFKEGIRVNGIELDERELKENYLHSLDDVFKPYKEEKDPGIENKKNKKRRMKSYKPVDRPKVVIPVFPGTNCEWDTAKAFEEQGAEAEIYVFKNQSHEDIVKSLDELAALIEKSQILALPGGFSLGDEPDGSGKFIANVLRSEKVAAAINKLLNENDGLIIGICNGFQALVKSGLLPYGEIKELSENSPTLILNGAKRHIARFVDTRVLTVNSPWLSELSEEKIYRLPISHGEGRFVVDEKVLKDLLDKEQVAAVYKVSPNGSEYNIEGIISEDGKILGKMGHSERVAKDLYKNIYDVELQNIFKGAVNYFRK